MAEMETSEQLRAIIDATPECMKIVARDGTLLFMNAAGLKIVGASSCEAVLGKSVYDIVAPDDRIRYGEFNQRVCNGEKASLEFDIVGFDGNRRHMETHAAPLRHTDGTTAHLAVSRDITERARSERQSLLLSAIVDSSDDAIISKNLDGVITSWNKSAQRLFGYTAEEAIGRTVAELLIPEDRQEEEPEILAKLGRGERVDHFETIRRRKDGSVVDISLTVSPVKDRHGRIIGASKIARDMSPRKRAAEAIQSLNRQLSADLSAMTRIHQLSTRMMQVGDFPALLKEIVEAAVDVTDAGMGNIQLFEDGMLKIAAHAGFDSDFLEFFHHVADADTACGSAMQSEDRVIIEDVSRSSVFSPHALDAMLKADARAVQSTPLVTRSGQLVGMLSTHYRTPRRPSERDLQLIDILARQTADLIERRRAEDALHASEERFRLAQKAAKIGVFEWNMQTGINIWSAELEELYGLQPGSFPRTQSAWEKLVHPEDRESIFKAVEDAISSAATVEAEWRVIWPDGSVHWIAGRFQVDRDTQGNPERMRGVNFEITERKRIENELRRANQDLEQFAFSASHDLQEPLRSVKIYSELLDREFADHASPDQQRCIRYIRSGATRMENFVRDLLAYNRVTTLDEPTETVDANEVLRIVLADLSGAVSDARAVIIAEPLPTSLPIHAAHLHQLFQNIVGNAIKYGGSNRTPEVHIKAERQSGSWTFAVVDNGIGIQPEFQESIFGLFKRLHTNEEYPGTGIGLAICQRIVERYRGRIWVESEIGKGATFCFSIPG